MCFSCLSSCGCVPLLFEQQNFPTAPVRDAQIQILFQKKEQPSKDTLAQHGMPKEAIALPDKAPPVHHAGHACVHGFHKASSEQIAFRPGKKGLYKGRYLALALTPEVKRFPSRQDTAGSYRCCQKIFVTEAQTIKAEFPDPESCA